MTYMKKILITGASGRLGKKLKTHFENALTPSEKTFDITQPLLCLEYMAKHRPAIVIHCAALTDVSYCEREPFDAYWINGYGTFNMADVCNEFKIPLIYISTDHVFDGEEGDYSENDTPNPTSVYAKSKLIGEWFVLAVDRNAVFRTSFMAEFPFEKAYTDKYFSAEKVDKIAEWIAKAVKKDFKGLWHIAGEPKSIFALAQEFDKNVKPMLLQDRPTNEDGIKYLKDTTLNTGKWQSAIYNI